MNSISHNRQNVSISPLVCVRIDFTLKIVVSNLSTRWMPHAVPENADLPPEHALSAVTVPKHTGINSTLGEKLYAC
jgi:hypothetical protein